MDVQSLEIFVSVARYGSFAETARHFMLDPSQVSRQISNLEEQLGFRLFHRTTRSLSFTESGEIYYERILVALEAMEAAKSAAEVVTKKPRGRLKLSASHAYSQKRLLPILAEFRSEFPAIDLEILVSNDSVDLAAEQIDLAIRHAPTINSEYICSILHKTTYKVVCSPEFASNLEIQHPTDLEGANVLRLNVGDIAQQWFFRKNAVVLNVPVSGTLTLSSPLALLQAVLEGNGPGMLADWLVEQDLKKGNLVDLLPDYEVSVGSFDASAWMIYLNRQHLPLKVRVMIDYLRKKLSRA